MPFSYLMYYLLVRIRGLHYLYRVILFNYFYTRIFLAINPARIDTDSTLLLNLIATGVFVRLCRYTQKEN